MSGELVERLPDALVEAGTPEEADLLRREVEAFIAVARKAPARDIEVEWPALLRLRLDAWRRWGELLGLPDEQERTAPGKRLTDGQALEDAEMKRRERARKLAFEVPDDAYFAYRARENADKLTLAGALRLVPAEDHGSPPPPEGKYRTLVVDPPWPMEKIPREVRPNQPKVLDYPTMDEDELRDFTVPAADDAHLYLWTTHKHLPLALDLADEWGFAYQCLLTWRKNVGITPFSWMYSTEHVVFARRGSLDLLAKGRRLDFEAKVREHSRKPDVFYELVTEVSPGPRIDMFAREAHEGFEAWGNEPERFADAA